MVFPLTKLQVKVELYLNAAWTDVTAYTYLRDPIQITRGRRDEGGSFEPGEAQLTFNNRDGRFSPRNPAGPYYGQLTRNTPIRISALVGSTRMVRGTSFFDGFNTPDSAGISITGDLDLRADLRVSNWAATAALLLKSGGGGDSWELGIDSTAHLKLSWSTTGAGLSLVRTSTVPLPQTTGRQAVRATLDVDNGAAGHTVTFYYADTMSGTWIQLGAAVVTAGVTSIFDGTAALRSCATTSALEIYSLKVLQGIAGTARANPDFTAQAEGATSFADAAGNTWTAVGTATVTGRRYRFYGEAPSWPQVWDISERDVWVPVAASGVLRRLGQGAAPLKGTITRGAQRDANVRAYWPMEDAQGSTSIASGLANGPAMTFTGTPNLASDDTFRASSPLPVIDNASFSGAVNTYTGTSGFHSRFLMAVPAAGDVDGGVILRMYTTGTAARWDLTYNTATAGDITVTAYDAVGVQLFTSTGSGTFANLNGKPVVVYLEFVQNGANIDWEVTTYDLTVASFLSGTLATRTFGATTSVQINPNQLLATTVIGHLIISSALPVDATIQAQTNGYLGETAGRRIERLCSEESVAFTGYGDLDSSAAMGVQSPQQLLDLLAECEASDLGQLAESREQLGLIYRTRQSRAIQPPLALAYNALRELNPVEDDQNTRNDVTVSRVYGSSARATVTTGPLSTLAPPNGVGLYDEQVDLNLGADTQCADQANLRAVIGTIDEPRYPVIGVQLGGTAFAASQALLLAALDVDHGDRITVTGTPIWVPRGTIDQHTIGQSETLGVREYEIDFVCQPATPVGGGDLYDSTTFRWAADGSTLSAGITSTVTGAAALSLVTTTGPLWTSAGGDFPLDIIVGGEQITLSAIAATASPQSATVSARSVNGVVKAHLAGEVVQIADPFYYQL